MSLPSASWGRGTGARTNPPSLALPQFLRQTKGVTFTDLSCTHVRHGDWTTRGLPTDNWLTGTFPTPDTNRRRSSVPNKWTQDRSCAVLDRTGVTIFHRDPASSPYSRVNPRTITRSRSTGIEVPEEQIPSFRSRTPGVKIRPAGRQGSLSRHPGSAGESPILVRAQQE